MENSKNKRFCLTCRKEIQGRADKKFCDYVCKNYWYNSVYKNKTAGLVKVNKILAINNSILNNLLYKKRKLRVSKSKLENLGFNFNYYTSVLNDPIAGYQNQCYEFQYKIENEEAVILKLKT